MFHQASDEKLLRKIFYLCALLMLIIVCAVSGHYGQSGDEWVQMVYGKDVYNYFATGDRQALDYENMGAQFVGFEYYGGLFEYVTYALSQWFPSINILIIRHFVNAITLWILVLSTGLLAYRLSKKWGVALLALLFIFFSPRIFGEGMNNSKDIPFAAGFAACMYGFLTILDLRKQTRWYHFVSLAFAFFLAFGTRPAGGILALAFMGVFTIFFLLTQKEDRQQLLSDKKSLKNISLFTVLSIMVGFVLALRTWPYGWESPIAHSLDALAGMTNRATNIRVLFEGEYWFGAAMPWYYEFKWLLISNPLVVIVGVVLFFVSGMQLKKLLGWYPLLIIAFGAFFPILYMIYKNSTVYDTWRHIFFVYPFWVLMASVGWYGLTLLVKNIKLRKWLPYLPLAGLLPMVLWMIKSHPNQYVYFNELAGGVKGAYGNYDLDYYYNTGKQGADWIIANAPKPEKGKKIVVASTMTGFDNYFSADSNWISSYYVRWNERNAKDWDYYVANPRYLSAEILQNDLFPPDNAVHIIQVNEVPLAAVLVRKSKAGIDAAEALNAKNFPLADSLYQQLLAVEKSDENVWLNYAMTVASLGRMDEAIQATQKAVQLDPARADAYQLLAQLYQFKGDASSAQNALNNANAINARIQEKLPEEN